MKTRAFRILIFIGTLIAMMSVGKVSVFAYTVSYTPGSQIPLTGSTVEVKMNTAGKIFETSASVWEPVFHTSTKTFSWGFYIADYGWATFSTGSYQVNMNCWSQYLSGLTSNCSLAGTGWSDLIGELDFSWVEFIPSSRTLSGNIKTFVGNFDVSGISLPLGKVEFVENLNDLIVHHEHSLALKNPVPGITNIKTSVGNDLFQSDDSNNWVLVVDLSKSSNNWQMIITNSWWITTYQGVIVKPEIPSTTLETLPADFTSYIEKYCTNNPDNCPDGSTLIPTTLSWNTSWVIADGSSTMAFTLKLRDKYGNRVWGKTIKITYEATVRKWQVDVLENTYGSILSWDAFVSAQFSSCDTNNYCSYTSTTSSSVDPTYSIKSYAPTNTSSDKIKLITISYDWADISWISQDYLLFSAPWTASLEPTGQLYTTKWHDFSLAVTKDSDNNLSNIPYIIWHLLIDPESDPYDINEYWNISTPVDCKKQHTLPNTNDLCEWNISYNGIDTYDSTFFAIQTGSTTTIHATYKTNTPSTPHKTYLDTYIHYTLDGNDMLYPSRAQNRSTSYSADSWVDPYKILGNSNSGSIATANARTDFFNDLRKNIAYLTREYRDGVNSEYVFSWSDISIDTWDSLNKTRTYIVVWGNITINADIIDPDSPVAFIALAKNGVWGAIIISGTVTDIHASLIAENGIEWSWAKTNQLYILGSVIARNTIGSGILTKIREDYKGLTWQQFATSNRAKDYKFTPVIIEHDGRILTNPPPGLRNFNP